MKVSFTNVDEFIEEMKKDAPTIDRGIVRRTFRYTSSNTPPFLRREDFIVGYVFKEVPNQPHGQLVELKAFIGHIGSRGKEDATVRLGNEHESKLKAACAELHLEIRSGVFEELAHETNHAT